MPPPPKGQVQLNALRTSPDFTETRPPAPTQPDNLTHAAALAQGCCESSRASQGLSPGSTISPLPLFAKQAAGGSSQRAAAPAAPSPRRRYRFREAAGQGRPRQRRCPRSARPALRHAESRGLGKQGNGGWSVAATHPHAPQNPSVPASRNGTAAAAASRPHGKWVSPHNRCNQFVSDTGNTQLRHRRLNINVAMIFRIVWLKPAAERKGTYAAINLDF